MPASTTRFDAAGAILLASENAVKTSLEAIQALGGAGYTKDWPVERFLRDAKLYDIGAGTNEIRRFLIGRELIGVMTQLSSLLDTNSEAFRANDAANRALAEALRAKIAAAAQGGSESAREKHTARGKLLPRERINRLLDAGSPFLETSPLAANGLYDNEAPGAGTDHRRRPCDGPRGDDRRQ